ncbi:MAG: hypothetical protein M3534_08465 [Actinomycetota bacterium]|nr:hypothetical protein [Actinomycetota bacterium]
MRNYLTVTALVLGLMVSVVLGAYVYWSYAQAAGSGAVVPGAAVVNQAQGGEDSAPSESSGENVPEPIDSVFVHRATTESISSNSTYLNNRLINNNPAAILSVTQNWNPGGSGGTYNDHPVGVWYDAGVRKWAIFNQDRAAMPEGAAFNVTVSGGAEPAGTR